MKKIVSMLLVGIMSISLCACGETETNKTTAKEEMLAEAEIISLGVLSEARGNLAKAKTHIDKVYQLTLYVLEVGEDYCLITVGEEGLDGNMRARSNNLLLVKVHLPNEDLVNLELDEEITVAGKITDVIVEDYETLGHHFDRYIYEMGSAYLVE